MPFYICSEKVTLVTDYSYTCCSQSCDYFWKFWKIVKHASFTLIFWTSLARLYGICFLAYIPSSIVDENGKKCQRVSILTKKMENQSNIKRLKNHDIFIDSRQSDSIVHFSQAPNRLCGSHQINRKMYLVF